MTAKKQHTRRWIDPFPKTRSQSFAFPVSERPFRASLANLATLLPLPGYSMLPISEKDFFS